MFARGPIAMMFHRPLLVDDPVDDANPADPETSQALEFFPQRLAGLGISGERGERRPYLALEIGVQSSHHRDERIGEVQLPNRHGSWSKSSSNV